MYPLFLWSFIHPFFLVSISHWYHENIGMCCTKIRRCVIVVGCVVCFNVSQTFGLILDRQVLLDVTTSTGSYVLLQNDSLPF